MKIFKYILIASAGIALMGCANSNDQPNAPSAKALATEQWNATRASVLLTLARDQYDNGAFDKCKQTLDQAEKLDPKNDAIAVLSAQLAVEQGDMEIAERELVLARKNNPKNAQAFYLSGVVYQRWAQPQQAYEMYSQATDLAPTELPYLMAKAEMLVSMDRSTEALALLQDKVSQFENSAVLCDAVGMLLTQQHRDAEAVDMLQRATILAPEDKSVREHYALELVHIGQYAEAIDQLHRILAPASNPYGGSLPADTAAAETAATDTATSDTAKADDYSARPALWIALGECQMETHDLAGARSSFETAVRLDGGNVDAWLSLGKAAMADGDLPRAQQCVAKATSLNDQNPQTLLLAGYVDLKAGKPRKAFDDFAAARQIDPEDSLNLCMMGYALSQMDQPKQAMAYYAAALKLAPNDALARALMEDAQRKM